MRNDFQKYFQLAVRLFVFIYTLRNGPLLPPWARNPRRWQDLVRKPSCSLHLQAKLCDRHHASSNRIGTACLFTVKITTKRCLKTTARVYLRIEFHRLLQQHKVHTSMGDCLTCAGACDFLKELQEPRQMRLALCQPHTTHTKRIMKPTMVLKFDPGG